MGVSPMPGPGHQPHPGVTPDAEHGPRTKGEAMSVNVTDMLKDFIKTLLNDRETAAQFASDPNGVLAAQGVSEHDLSRVDVPRTVGEVCADPSVAQGTRQALQSYSSGSGGPAQSHGPQSMEQVVQHLNYVTYATYE